MRLVPYVDAERERIVDALFAWLRIPSISAHPDRAGDVRASAAFCADQMRAAGLEHVVVLETAGAPAVYGDWVHAGPDAPTALVYGHHDVQPVDPLELWHSPPFEPVIVADGEHGSECKARGAIDDKGQVLYEIEAVRGLLALDGADTLRYADVKRGQRRAVRLVRDGADAHLEGFLLGGDTRAEAWIKALLQDRLPAQAFGRQLLRPGASAPSGVAARGKVICSCFGVTQTAISEQVALSAGTDDERLARLQETLKCGTNCGSCLPELKRMVRAGAAPALAEAP